MANADSSLNGRYGSGGLTRREFMGAAVGLGLAATGVANLEKFVRSSDRSRSSSSKVTEITFWWPSGFATAYPIMHKLINDYNAHIGPSEGVHINASDVSTANNYLKYTQSMSTSSASPDLVMTYGFNPVVQWAASGLVYPLDTLAGQLHFKPTDFYPFVWDMQHFAGHTWGLLQEWDADLLYWNKQIHTGPPPTTIAEIDTLSAKYTTFNKNGQLEQVGIVPWAQGGLSSAGYGDWGLIFGAEFYDTASAKWTITKPQNKRFLEWYLKYVHMLGGIGKVNSLLSSVPATMSAGVGSADIFNYGKSAFCMLPEWFPPEFVATVGAKTAAKLDYGISPNLVSAEGINSGKQSLIVGANLFLIPRNSHNPTAAAKVIRYMVEPQSVVAWGIPIGQGMPTPAAQTNPTYLKDDPWMKYWVQGAQRNFFVGEPSSPVFQTFDTEMGVAIEGLTGGKYTPAQALSYVDNQVSQAVSRFQEENPEWHGQ
jgi:ABC-type glycerol-3-phosphate transport system substrate-binding protein